MRLPRKRRPLVEVLYEELDGLVAERWRYSCRLVVGEALALTAAGAIAGGIGAIAASRFIEATLFGVQPTDARTYAIVGAVIFGAAVLASLLPAQRAVRVDPAVVLKAE